MKDIYICALCNTIDGGHDSKEDAIACMNLMQWKIKSDLQKTIRRESVT